MRKQTIAIAGLIVVEDLSFGLSNDMAGPTQRFRWTWPCSVPMAEALQGRAHGEMVPFVVAGLGIRATYRQARRQYVCEYLSDAVE